MGKQGENYEKKIVIYHDVFVILRNDSTVSAAGGFTKFTIRVKN